ncbi:MAG: adenosylcobinamide-GDP ribazoletransferase [Acidiferrobacterales bacterium]
MLRSLRIAVQFLTRIPVPPLGTVNDDETGRSILWYPLVGLIIGSVLLALWSGTNGLSPLLRAALILAVWVLITGALHLDGLADSADAWLGGLGDRERTLAIMKDPYCGPGAVTTLIVVLIVKFAALDTIATDDNWMALVIAPLLGRTALPLLFLTTHYVRPGGLGAILASHMPRRSVVLILAAIGLVILFVLGRRGVLLILINAILFVALRHMMMRRIGGTTGDTAGSLVELIELASLLIMT